MAFVIPDVAWYDSQAIGWAGTNPDQQGDSSLGHGLIEQVFVDGLDNFLSCYGLALSLRATIPFLNGFILPSAPPVVEEKVLPFLAYISDPFVAVFRCVPFACKLPHALEFPRVGVDFTALDYVIALCATLGGRLQGMRSSTHAKS
eukprot:1678144-Rhodomonas_salina.2